CLSGWGINHVIKLIVQRDRPSTWEAVEGIGYSFPSGHATSSVVCYGLLTYFLIKKVGNRKSRLWIIFIISVLILFIGVSRYVIHVNVVTDIIHDFKLGYIIIVIWIKMFKNMSKKK